MKLVGKWDSISLRKVILPYIEIAVRDLGNLVKDFKIPVDLSYDADDFFHASSHSYDDARLLYFRMNPETHPLMEFEEFDFETRMVLTMGSAIHSVIQEALKQKGFVKDEHIEVLVEDLEKKIRGHMDLMFPLPEEPTGLVPVEIKSVHPDVFQYLKEPLDYWDRQFSVYIDNKGYDYGYLVAIEMGRPYRMKEFKIYKNKEYLEKLYAKLGYVNRKIAEGTPPEEVCISKEGVPCSINSKMMRECPARNICLKTFPTS